MDARNSWGREGRDIQRPLLAFLRIEYRVRAAIAADLEAEQEKLLLVPHDPADYAGPNEATMQIDFSTIPMIEAIQGWK